jgi:hypothetical protein
MLSPSEPGELSVEGGLEVFGAVASSLEPRPRSSSRPSTVLRLYWLGRKENRRNKMKLPGFTAEASLYNSSEHYKPHTTFGVATQQIIPQRMKIRDVHCACDSQSDICVCDDGSVFNDVTGLIDMF